MKQQRSQIRLQVACFAAGCLVQTCLGQVGDGRISIGSEFSPVPSYRANESFLVLGEHAKKSLVGSPAAELPHVFGNADQGVARLGDEQLIPLRLGVGTSPSSSHQLAEERTEDTHACTDDNGNGPTLQELHNDLQSLTTQFSLLAGFIIGIVLAYLFDLFIMVPRRARRKGGR